MLRRLVDRISLRFFAVRSPSQQIVSDSQDAVMAALEKARANHRELTNVKNGCGCG